MKVTWVYGFNDSGMRRKLRENIEEIHKLSIGPLEIMGDFNNVMQPDERLGRKVTFAEIKDFKVCIQKYDLYEMKLSGSF